MQRLDIRTGLDALQASGQRFNEFRETPGLQLRLLDADLGKADGLAGATLCEDAEVGTDHGCDLRITAGAAAIAHQHDRLAAAGNLDAAVHRAVRDDIVAL